MSMPRTESGRRGGLARARNQTPEQRRALASRGHLAQAVKAVASRYHELSSEQRQHLATILAGDGEVA